LRIATSADSSPIDIVALAGALPLFADRWRALSFGPEDGHPGLTVESGTHPLPGARYRLQLKGESERSTVLGVEILEDNSTRTRLRLEAEGQTTELTVRHLLNPDAIETRSLVDTGGEWPMRGGLTVIMKVDLQKAHPAIHVDVEHRLLLVRAEAVVDTSNATKWTTRMTANVRGRSVLRPLTSVGLLLARPVVRRQMEKMHTGFASAVDAFNTRLADELGGTPTSDRIADYAMRELVENLS
jgi:hypothetical protein